MTAPKLSDTFEKARVAHFRMAALMPAEMEIKLSLELIAINEVRAAPTALLVLHQLYLADVAQALEKLDQTSDAFRKACDRPATRMISTHPLRYEEMPPLDIKYRKTAAKPAP